MILWNCALSLLATRCRKPREIGTNCEAQTIVAYYHTSHDILTKIFTQNSNKCIRYNNGYINFSSSYGLSWVACPVTVYPWYVDIDICMIYDIAFALFCTVVKISDCWPLPSNQSFYRQIASYQRGVGDHRVGQCWEGLMGQQNSCKTLIEVHSTMHLMHPQLRSWNYHLHYFKAYHV